MEERFTAPCVEIEAYIGNSYYRVDSDGQQGKGEIVGVWNSNRNKEYVNENLLNEFRSFLNNLGNN